MFDNLYVVALILLTAALILFYICDRLFAAWDKKQAGYDELDKHAAQNFNMIMSDY